MDSSTRVGGRGPGGAGISGKSLGVFTLLFFLAWGLRATVLFPLDQRVEPPLLRAVYAHGWKFAVWVLPAFVYVRAVAGRDPLAYMKLTTRPRRRGLFAAACASVLFFAAVILFESFTAGKNLDSLYRSTLPAFALTALGVSVSPVFEEILFRGFFLQAFRERMGFRGANLLAAALFVFVHWPHWLWAAGRPAWLVPVSASIFVLGVFLGLVLRWTDSLWPCVVVHVVNNVLASYLRA